jgi:GxxExxY protein
MRHLWVQAGLGRELPFHRLASWCLGGEGSAPASGHEFEGKASFTLYCDPVPKNTMNHQDTKTPREPIPTETDEVASKIVDAAFAVHKALGPGLLESVYEACLLYELNKRGLKVERQVSLPVVYDNLRLDAGLRLDLVVEKRVIVELKAVEVLLPVHTAQLLTYLKLSGYRLGLLVNFNSALIKEGIKRIVL